jgi:2Fe-2S ferredoxin
MEHKPEAARPRSRNASAPLVASRIGSMIKIAFAGPGPGGETRLVECDTGQSLMQAALEAGLSGIEADCGGILNCATCHVYVREPHFRLLPAASGAEQDMLEFTASPRKPNSRLSCQIPLTDALDGLAVDIPETQT